MTRSVDDLAADVRRDAEFLRDAASQGGVVFSQLACEQMSRRAYAIVALVGTLTERLAIREKQRNLAESQVAALTQERDELRIDAEGHETWLKAAEAALAEMRRALEGAAEGEEELATRARAGPDHMGAAIHSHAASILRALAAAGPVAEETP